MVTPNNYRAVSIMVVPAVVPSAIIPTVISVVPVAIVSVVATDPETELLRTGERRCCHTECRHCGEDITNLPHCASPFAGYDWQTRRECRRSGNSRETLLNRRSPSLQCGSTSSSRSREQRRPSGRYKIDPGDVAPRGLGIAGSSTSADSVQPDAVVSRACSFRSRMTWPPAQPCAGQPAACARPPAPFQSPVDLGSAQRALVRNTMDSTITTSP